MLHRRFLFRNRSSDRRTTQGVSFAISPDFAALSIEAFAPTSVGAGITISPAIASLVLTGQAPVAAITQYARPTSDVAGGLWLASTGASLFGTVDEIIADDVDYDYTHAPSTLELGFSSINDPASSSDHVLSYRIKGDGATNMTVSLREGTTQIASWTHTTEANTFTTYARTLSAAEANAITNYADLRIRVVAG